MYGRGAADDKSGIVIHSAAIRALLADGDLPVTIKVVSKARKSARPPICRSSSRATPT